MCKHYIKTVIVTFFIYMVSQGLRNVLTEPLDDNCQLNFMVIAPELNPGVAG
jgi:hypothetical protein